MIGTSILAGKGTKYLVITSIILVLLQVSKALNRQLQINFILIMSIRNPSAMALPVRQLRPLVLSTIRWKPQGNPTPNYVSVRWYMQKPPIHRIDLTPRPTSQKKWNQLTSPQKVVRTVTTGGNLLIILAGMALTVCFFFPRLSGLQKLMYGQTFCLSPIGRGGHNVLPRSIITRLQNKLVL